MPNYKIDGNTSNKLRLAAFVSTVIIVMYHAQVGYESFNVTETVYAVVSSLFEFVASMAMAFFFMKSGYLLYFNADRENIGRKIKSRFRSLAVPFLLWNVIGLIVSADVPSEPLGVLIRFTVYPYVGPLWYVFAIWVLAFFLPLGVMLRDRKRLCLACLAVVCALSAVLFYLGVILRTDNTYVAWLVRFARYFPAYCIGAAAGILKPRLISVGIKSKSVKIAGGVMFLLFFVWQLLMPLLPRLAIVNRFIFMFGIILCTIFVWLMIPSTSCENESPICRNSFLIYASHALAISIFRPTLMKVATLMDCPYFAAAVLVPALCTLCIWLAAAAVELAAEKLQCEKALNILTGGR